MSAHIRVDNMKHPKWLSGENFEPAVQDGLEAKGQLLILLPQHCSSA